MTTKLDQRSIFRRAADTAEWALYYATGQTDLALAKALDIQAHEMGRHSGVAFSEIRKGIIDDRTNPLQPNQYFDDVRIPEPETQVVFEEELDEFLGNDAEKGSRDPLEGSILPGPEFGIKEVDSKIPVNRPAPLAVEPTWINPPDIDIVGR
jgi:hypothetical protein